MKNTTIELEDADEEGKMKLLSKLELIVPEIEELGYRKKLLSDPDTMSYNRGLRLGFSEYDNETGCIDFPQSKWEKWYKKWINNEPSRYYAYIVEKENQIPIGEVALRYDTEREIHIISIIIENKYRDKGCGKESLKLLLDKAFYDFGLEKVADHFPESRISATKLFRQCGFEITERADNQIFIELDRNKYFKLIDS